MIGRRFFVAGGLALLGGCTSAGQTPIRDERLEDRFLSIRTSLGRDARLGIGALDTGSGRFLGFDADSRYAMCSTFKMALAAAILAEADRSALSLSDERMLPKEILQDYAPVVRARHAEGRLNLETLCAASVEVSDNEAANLLLARLGGPEQLSRYFRRWGDTVTRLDRNEPSLNTNLPGDVRDTTTPRAMVALMKAVLVDGGLMPQSRERLIAWMERSTTGLERLRAGLPRGWRVGDKTGTGANGAHNDIAILWPPDRPPILIASYQSGGSADPAARNAAHQAVGRLISERFG